MSNQGEHEKRQQVIIELSDEQLEQVAGGRGVGGPSGPAYAAGKGSNDSTDRGGGKEIEKRNA